MFRQRAQLLLSRTLSVATTVVATSDYVSPNKSTDCSGIIDVIGANYKEYNNYNHVNDDNCTEKHANRSSSYSFNNNNVKNDKENDLYKLAASVPSGNNGTSLSTTSLHPPSYPPLHLLYPPLHPPSYPSLHPPSYPPLHQPYPHQLYPHQLYQSTAITDCTANDATANDSLFHRTSNSDCIRPQKGSGATTNPMATTDVLPNQTFSSTSDAMWTLSPPSSPLLEEEFAISSIAEEFGIGDQELPMEFLIDKFRNKLEVLPDLNISASTMNIRTTTQKRKRPSTWDFNGGVYVEPAEDSQDYSKSDGLVYSKDPHAKGLKLDKEPLDEEKVKEGRWYVHATPAANLFDPTITNLEHHSFDLAGGIMEQGLQPMVQTGKKSKKPIEGVWALPGGRVMSSIAHIVRTHAEALKKSGGKIALIMIYADDDRINKFTRMGGSIWAQTCHPAYSREEIPVYPKDVLIVDIKELPVFLKEIKVRTDLIPLKTDAEKKATYDLWYHHGGGKEYHAEWYKRWYYNGGGKEKQADKYRNGGGKEYLAARYAASTNHPVKRHTHTHTRGARCTDATLGLNGVLHCRLDTTLSHSRLKKKGDQPRCALHNWAGKNKRTQIKYCETCDVHLCSDCFTTFHTNFDLVAVKKQLHNTDSKQRVIDNIPYTFNPTSKRWEPDSTPDSGQLPQGANVIPPPVPPTTPATPTAPPIPSPTAFDLPPNMNSKNKVI